MRTVYRQELTQLGLDLERMSSGVTVAIERATQALREGDMIKAEQTGDADDRLDQLSRHIDETCVSLLLLQGPVASDLRLIVAGLRLTQTMERQGDLAAPLALIARNPHQEPGICPQARPLITKMTDAAVQMAHSMEKVVQTQDLNLARRMHRDDDILDDLQIEARRMATDDDNDLTRAQVIDVTLAARFLERFGDHAVSVADQVMYIVEGAQTA